jgi:hypothetical protein
MADASFPWWAWLALGLILLLLEMLTPGGFYVFFFGAGAIVVGILALLGVAGPLWLQVVLFAIFSIASLALFRRPILERLRAREPGHAVDSLVGEVATARDAIAPAGGLGQVTLRGSVWNAVNAGAHPIGAGELCTVTRVDNLQLHVVRR